MFQSLQSLLMLVFVALYGDVNTGVAQVICHANFGDSDHRQARIFKFESDNLRDLFPQCLSDAFCPMHNSDIRSQTSDVRYQPEAQKSDVGYPTSDPRFLQFRRRHPLDNVGLDLVADFNVVEVFQTDTALKAFAHFGDVVLKAAQ
jgi:hypothetical protein